MSENSPATTCCIFCLRFIVTAGFAALFIWLSLRTTKPSCSLEQFYLPALDKAVNSQNTTKASNNNSLSFQLNLKNKMKDKGVFYDDINLSFYYGTNTSFPIGNTTVKGFYQGHGKEAHKSWMLQIQKMPWDDALKAVSNGSKAVLRIDVATRIRYKIMFWHTKRHNFVVNDKRVHIDDTGKSGAQQLGYCLSTLGLTLFVLSLLL